MFKNKSLLHHLIHVWNIKPDKIEMIMSAIFGLKWSPLYKITVPANKIEKFQTEEEDIIRFKVFTDRSYIQGGVSMEAVLLTMGSKQQLLGSIWAWLKTIWYTRWS
jgi:hypothetical protein